MQNLYTTRLTRLGNSLAIIIPKSILTAQNLQRGDLFGFGIYDDNKIILKKLSDKEILQIKPPDIDYGK